MKNNSVRRRKKQKKRNRKKSQKLTSSVERPRNRVWQLVRILRDLQMTIRQHKPVTADPKVINRQRKDPNGMFRQLHKMMHSHQKLIFYFKNTNLQNKLYSMVSSRKLFFFVKLVLVQFVFNLFSLEEF